MYHSFQDIFLFKVGNSDYHGNNKYVIECRLYTRGFTKCFIPSHFLLILYIFVRPAHTWCWHFVFLLSIMPAPEGWWLLSYIVGDISSQVPGFDVCLLIYKKDCVAHPLPTQSQDPQTHEERGKGHVESLLKLRAELALPTQCRLQVKAEPPKYCLRGKNHQKARSSQYVKSANTKEAKEMQILPLELNFYKSFPPPPRTAAQSWIDFPEICPLSSQTGRDKEFCLQSYILEKHWQGFLLSSQGCGRDKSTASASEWLRLQNHPAEPALCRNLKSEAFLFYSFSFLSQFYISIFFYGKSITQFKS